MDRIEQRLKENSTCFSIEEVIERYEEKENEVKHDFDYQVKIESWQVDHVTTKGIYLNVDFGVSNHGQLFIGGYKVDQSADGDFNLYVKYDDVFYFMNEKNSERNRYMNGETLVKQLSLYNGTVPLKKEPVMSELDDIISAINFLADHNVNDGLQLQRLEMKLERSLQEAQNKLKELDEKLVDLNQLAKNYLITNLDNKAESDQSIDYESIQKELASVKLSRSILNDRFNEIVGEIEVYREIQYISEATEDKTIYDDTMYKK